MKSRLIAALLVVAVGLCAVSVFILTKFDGAPEDTAVRLVPPDALFYSSLFIKPSTDQKKNLRDLFARFPQAPSFEESRDDLLALLDPYLAEAGLSYEEDIDPWLGSQAAFFAGSLDPATGEPAEVGFMLATDDPEATEETLLKLSEVEDPTARFGTSTHDGVTYQLQQSGPEPLRAFVFLEGFLVLGTDEGVKAAIEASNGRSLKTAASYAAATGALPDDRLIEMYFSVEGLLDDYGSLPSVPPEAAEMIQLVRDLGLDVPIALSIRAEPDAAILDSALSVPTEGFYRDISEALTGEGIIPELPEGSVFTFGAPELGEIVTQSLELAEQTSPNDVAQGEAEIQDELGLDLREDILGWMGDAAFFIEGTSLQRLGGGLVIESKDEAKTSAFVDRLLELANKEEPGIGQPAEVGGLQGFAVQPPGSLQPVNVLGGERFVIAYGQTSTEGAITADPALGSSQLFRRAEGSLGDGYSPFLYGDLQGLRKLGEGFFFFSGVDNSGYEDDVEPWIEPLGFLISGFKLENDVLLQRLVIGAE